MWLQERARWYLRTDLTRWSVASWPTIHGVDHEGIIRRKNVRDAVHAELSVRGEG